MSAFVVVLLAALWVAILVPGALRGRHHSPATSVDSFERSMRILATDLRSRLPGDRPMEGGAAHLAAPGTDRAWRPATSASSARQRTLHRRRLVLQCLGTITGAAALLAVAFGGAFVVVVGVSAVALGAYVTLLLQLRSNQDGLRRTVRHLPIRAERQPDDLPLAVGEQR